MIKKKVKNKKVKDLVNRSIDSVKVFGNIAFTPELLFRGAMRQVILEDYMNFAVGFTELKVSIAASESNDSTSRPDMMPPSS